MSPNPEPTTVILPLDLGAAAKYDQHVFPLAYHDGQGGNIKKGSILLSATLEEMVKIKEMGIDLSKSDKFLFNTRVKYEALAVKRAKLQNNSKTLNPFKTFLNYRAAHMFHVASLNLYLDTKETSEKMQRDQKHMQTVPSTEMLTVNNALPADATIAGIAINLPGVLNDAAIRTIFDATNTIASYASDPFSDKHRMPQWDDGDEMSSPADMESLVSHPGPSGSGVDEHPRTPTTCSSLGQPDTTNPGSPPTINHIHVYHNSVVATNSNVSGLTVSHGSRKSGG